MLKEAIGSLADNFKERASSPILGSYTVAALLCNWKPAVVVLTSKSTGGTLIEEINAVLPGVLQGLIYPLGFALAFSVLYPTLKAAIAAFNTGARIMELKSEHRLEEWKDRVAAKKSDVESVISVLVDLANRDKIGYHDLKRIHDSLPRPEDLEIGRSSAKS